MRVLISLQFLSLSIFSFSAFIYSAASGLSCGTQHLPSITWDLLLQLTDSLVVGGGLSCSMARGIPITQSRIKPMSPARWIPNPWTTREISILPFEKRIFKKIRTISQKMLRGRRCLYEGDRKSRNSKLQRKTS